MVTLLQNSILNTFFSGNIRNFFGALFVLVVYAGEDGIDCRYVFYFFRELFGGNRVFVDVFVVEQFL